VLAIVLWLVLGWRWAAAEMFAEIIIGVALMGGGRGGKLMKTLKLLAKEQAGRAKEAKAKVAPAFESIAAGLARPQ
jgi:hypothetical protein